MLKDFKRALARVQSDYAFYIACQEDPTSALEEYDLSPEERSALSDPETLQDYLLRFYPADHEASLVATKTFPLMRSVVQRLRLGDLAMELAGAPVVGTLYIPAVSSRPVEDIELLEVMLNAGRWPEAESADGDGGDAGVLLDEVEEEAGAEPIGTGGQLQAG